MLIGRHSFIRQNKLSDVAGRIDYISNPKRQEHLYATYQTEGATPEFWKNLARENQLDFKTSGTAPGRAKYPEYKSLICAMGVFRSQTPRAL